MNDQGLNEKISIILDRSFNYRGEAFEKDLSDILELIKQDRELYGIECRLDESRRARGVDVGGGIKVVGHEKALGHCITMLDRIAELQTKKDNLIKGVE